MGAGADRQSRQQARAKPQKRPGAEAPRARAVMPIFDAGWH